MSYEEPKQEYVVERIYKVVLELDEDSYDVEWAEQHEHIAASMAGNLWYVNFQGTLEGWSDSLGNEEIVPENERPCSLQGETFTFIRRATWTYEVIRVDEQVDTCKWNYNKYSKEWGWKYS